MSVQWEKKEGNEGVLTVTVPAEKFDEALDKAFKKVVKDVQIPGFRKGRVPRSIFENRFGVESLYQDAVDIILPESYADAVEEAEIEPVAQPEIDIEEIAKGKDFVFTATVTVKPEVELGEYKGLEVEEEEVEVTEEDLDLAIESEREKQAELVLKEDGEVEEGDTVVIDFEGFQDGVAFEGGKGENHPLEIGSGQFIPGFEEQLIGKKSGEEATVEITFPEEYQAEELAGKDATFEVKIHEIKVQELPELDDEFAKDVDEEVETLDELKQKRKEELQKEKEEQADFKKRETLVQKASENATIDIPEAMVESELEQMVSEFEQRLQMQGMTMDMYSQFSGQTIDELKEQMREDAGKRVRSNLTLEAIFDQEKLEVSDEAVNEELENMANMYGVELEQITQMLGGNTDMVKSDLKFKTAIDYLVEQSKVVS
ncbi:MAG TPA: trigger factor [Bacillota bacterium]|nr:trigger factor [Bacillota bacterium]